MAAEILASPILRRPVTQLAILAHIGEMEDRIERGHDATAETTALRIREILGLTNSQVHGSMNCLRRDRIIVQGDVIKVRYGYSGPSHSLTLNGRQMYALLRRCRQ